MDKMYLFDQSGSRLTRTKGKFSFFQRSLGRTRLGPVIAKSIY
jgi:hypothetical protein